MTAAGITYRRTALVGLLAVSMGQLGGEALGARSGAAARECRPVADAAPRESSAYVDPEPSEGLKKAVERFQRSDPDATFTFSDCEVDSFSTKPKPTVPKVARTALRGTGLRLEPGRPEVLAAPTKSPKPNRDLDGAMGDEMLPLPQESSSLPSPPPGTGEGGDGAEGDPSTVLPPEQHRTQPASDLEPRHSDYTPPTPEQERAEAAVAKRVLLGFLQQYDAVFRMGGELRADLPGLQQVDFDSGRFFRRATFTQSVRGEPVLGSKTVVLFDVNWNVIAISRTLLTPAKLGLPPTPTVPDAQAVEIARTAVASFTGRTGVPFSVAEATLGLDPIRRLRAWQVRLVTPSQLPDFSDFTVLVKAEGGQVLNISDNIEAFTDASTRRWAYTSGDLRSPYQVTSTGVYTSDDNTLRHDFFDLETDNRGTAPQADCGERTGLTSSWRADAYGSDDNDVNIRHTHRPERDFSIWSPAHSSGSFGESHAYYWSRAYFLWNRDALTELGVADDARVTIIVNACINDVGIANSSFDVSIQHNEGEDNGTVRLGEECRSTNPTCSPGEYDDGESGHFWTCEGGGCYPNASVIQHELNHRVLGGFLGIGSGLDCDANSQLKFLHEGLLGSVMPQAFWHFWYGVGFDPDTDRLFTADATRGRVHGDAASLLELADFSCSDYDDGGQDPYEAGRVAGQPLWEIYHGKLVEGNAVANTYRPANDTDFQILSYWAADLMSASTYKDRYEFANRVMEILELSGWPADAKATYCDIWDHHGLDTFIVPSYCS